jgi:hypothetical protein
MRSNLFVRNAAECIIGILPLQIDNKFGELMIMAKLIGGVLCIGISNRTVE